MHEVDIIEDLAIAYGYDNLTHVNPEMATKIRDQPVGRLTDFVRHECAGAGFNEAYNFALLSKEDCFLWFRRDINKGVPSGAGTSSGTNGTVDGGKEYEFDRIHTYLREPKPVTISDPKVGGGRGGK